LIKFNISIIILLIFGIVIFFVGWIQLYIPPDTVAVIHTQTNGFNEEVILSGEFAWMVENLLPTNVTLYCFNNDPVTIQSDTIKGTLPSAELYAAFIAGTTKFDYEINISVKLQIKQETLPYLVEYENLSPDNHTEWLKTQVQFMTQDILNELMEKDSFVKIDNVIIRSFIQQLNENYPYMDIQDLIFNTLKLPDINLYHTAREQYYSLLEEYGEVLTKHFILSKYLYQKELNLSDLEQLNDDLENNFSSNENNMKE
jgi:hypothetical protein